MRSSHLRRGTELVTEVSYKAVIENERKTLREVLTWVSVIAEAGSRSLQNSGIDAL